MADPSLDPLKPQDAKKLARQIVDDGTVEFSHHAEEEMRKDDLIASDCLNLIRAGAYQPPDFINGQWRYRAQTVQMCVVITFRSATRLRVVTAWRVK
jgi:hypothetical protein